MSDETDAAFEARRRKGVMRTGLILLAVALALYVWTLAGPAG